MYAAFTSEGASQTAPSQDIFSFKNNDLDKDFQGKPFENRTEFLVFLVKFDHAIGRWHPLRMCNLYSQTTGVQAIRDFVDAVTNTAGNLEPQPGIFPDYMAPIIRNTASGRELARARWGLPSPAFALKNRSSDSGITNVRNTASAHWRRWLNVEHRCVVPFTSFSEPEEQPDGRRPPAWFALDESRPLAFFAGIWVPQWRSVRKVKEGETVNDLFGFLTCEPNVEVGAIHPKAMPTILTTKSEVEMWLTVPVAAALKLQRPLADGTLKIVARGQKEDGL